MLAGLEDLPNAVEAEFMAWRVEDVGRRYPNADRVTATEFETTMPIRRAPRRVAVAVATPRPMRSRAYDRPPGRAKKQRLSPARAGHGCRQLEGLI